MFDSYYTSHLAVYRQRRSIALWALCNNTFASSSSLRSLSLVLIYGTLCCLMPAASIVGHAFMTRWCHACRPSSTKFPLGDTTLYLLDLRSLERCALSSA